MSKPKILLVCEEIIIAHVILFVLKKDDYDLVLCHDGSSALEKLKSTSFDFLITEIYLPFFSGFDLIHIFTKSKPISQVLILSAVDNPGLLERSLNSKEVKKLNRPYNPQEIMKIVKEGTQYITRQN